MKKAIQTGGSQMKVVMAQTMCSADGNAYKNTVLDIPASRMQEVEVDGKATKVPLAEYMLQQKYAREYNPSTDHKLKQYGLVKAER
jgi:hypothetical protein